MKMVLLTFRLIAVRVTQLLCNFLKGIFYIHFWLFPSQRFDLPSASRPLLKSKHGSRIPKIFWQTNFTKRVTLPIYINYLWNRILAPTFEYRLLLDDECLAYVKEHFDSAIFDAFARLQVGAAKADFWRVLALYKEGGIYLDIDAALCWPPEWTLSQSHTELLIHQKGKVTNFFLASCPHNKLMAEVMNTILSNIQRNELTSVFDMTGPTVIHDAVTIFGGKVEAARLVSRQSLLTSKIFQYVDKPRGQWWLEQQDKKIVS